MQLEWDLSYFSAIKELSAMPKFMCLQVKCDNMDHKAKPEDTEPTEEIDALEVPSESSGKVNYLLLAGILTGVFLLLVILGLIFLCIFLCSKKKKTPQEFLLQNIDESDME
jgi:hypothetical protein